MLGAGDRVARNEGRTLRQHGQHLADHRRLDRADLGEDGAFAEMRATDFTASAVAPTGTAISTSSASFTASAGVLATRSQKPSSLARASTLGRAVVADDAPGEAACLQTTRDRGADQPEPDNGDGVEDRLGH